MRFEQQREQLRHVLSALSQRERNRNLRREELRDCARQRLPPVFGPVRLERQRQWLRYVVHALPGARQRRRDLQRDELRRQLQ
jgi:hypothetical protein